jgi:hypothetical protein
MSEMTDFVVDIVRVWKMPAMALSYPIRSIFLEDSDRLKPKIFGAFSGVEPADWRRCVSSMRVLSLFAHLISNKSRVERRRLLVPSPSPMLKFVRVAAIFKPLGREESELLPFHRAMKFQCFFMSQFGLKANISKSHEVLE